MMPRFERRIGLWLHSESPAHFTEVKNYWWLLPLAWIVSPSRVFPRRGIPLIGRREVTVKLRCGDAFRLRINEVFTIFEVYAIHCYDFPELSMESIDNIVDVGSNVGVATLWLMRQYPHARLTALEPAADSYRRMMENVSRSGLADRVNGINAGVGASNGDGFLVQGVSSTVSHVDRHIGTSGIAVNVIDLPNLLSLVGGSIDLMKIDCEGAEYEFLGGASLDDLKCIRALIGEFHPASVEKQQAFFDHLEAAGFRVRRSTNFKFDDGAIGVFGAWRD